MTLLKREVERLWDVRLLIVDPVSPNGGKADTHRNSEVRTMLAPLTELAHEHPLHVVTAWLDNSETIATKHYLSVTPEHMQRAIEGVWLPGVMPSVMPHDVDLPSIPPQSQIRLAV